MEKARILIITEVFYPEEFVVNDLALSWKEQGYSVDVITPSPTYPLGKVFLGYKNRLFSKETYAGINIFRVRAITGYRNSLSRKIFKYINFMFLGSIRAALIGNRYDCVFGYNLGSLTDMLPAVVIRKLHKKPVVFWVQDVWPDSVYAYGFKKTKILTRVLNNFVKFVYRHASAVVISSKGFQRKIEPYLNQGVNLIYAPNWATDLDLNSDPVTLSETDKVHFTFAGNIGKVQNLENIINAFRLLPNNYKDKSQFNIIGDGSNLRNLRTLAKGEKNIVFYGQQERQRMFSFYKASNFLIVSLIGEPIFSMTVPGKLQTYIAAKKPILAIINGEVADIVNHNNIGLSVDPSSVSLIRKSLKRCIDMSESERDALTLNNSELLKTTFNKENIINTITNQIENCVKK